MLGNGHQDLLNEIGPVTHLIRGAIFRSQYTTSSLWGYSLGELLDMYHTHEVTVLSDKVYVLLGMSSEDKKATALLLDYSAKWETLFRQLVKFILFKNISVETWADRKDIEVIRSKGYTLGHVLSVKNDSAEYNIQHIEVILNNTTRSLEYKMKYGTRWTLQASAKVVQKHDIICLLQGTSKPTIVRPCYGD